MSEPLVPVPLSLLTRIADELARTAKAFEDYHRDALPHLQRLREIDEAREAVRARVDAERIEGRGRAEKLLTSRAAYGVYGLILALLGTWLGAAIGIAPPGVALAIPTTSPTTEDVTHAPAP
jgi:hypothetical protein